MPPMGSRSVYPWLSIALGIALMLFAVAAPMAMIVGVVETTFWLSFLAYAGGFAGFIMGLLGFVFSR